MLKCKLAKLRIVTAFHTCLIRCTVFIGPTRPVNAAKLSILARTWTTSTPTGFVLEVE